MWGELSRIAGGSCAFVGQDDVVDMPHPSADCHEGCVIRVIPIRDVALTRRNILAIVSIMKSSLA
jgi:hypothetical protein